MSDATASDLCSCFSWWDITIMQVCNKTIKQGLYSSFLNKKRHHECNADSFNYFLVVMTFWKTPWYIFISELWWNTQTIFKYVWTNRCTTQILLWIICGLRWNIQISLGNISGLKWNTLTTSWHCQLSIDLLTALWQMGRLDGSTTAWSTSSHLFHFSLFFSW